MKKNQINVTEIIETAKKSALTDFATLAKAENFSREELDTLVTAFNSLEDSDKTAENFKHLENAVALINKAYKTDTLLKYQFLNNAELLKALCNVTIEYDMKSEPKKIANTVKNAIAYDFIRLADDNGIITIKDGKKALTILDILTAKTDSYTSIHADGIQTKEDVKKATDNIIDSTTKGILYCAINTACKLNNISDTKIKTTAEFNKVYKALQMFFESQNKENPFAKTSNNALQTQLEISLSAMFGNADYDSKCTKAYAQMLYNMLVPTNTTNGLQVVCNDIFKALQCFIIVCRYMYNGIKPMIQVNKTIHTTK